MRRLAFLAVAGLCAASALAAEPRRTIDASQVLDAGLPRPAAAPLLTPTPPDPPPLVERRQWVFDLRWDRGEVWLLGVQALDLPAAQGTPRVMGRFALELFEGAGPAIVERVRFDFPLLGAPEADAGAVEPALGPRLRTRIGVVFPATTRGARLELADRATGRRWSLPWPPGRPEDAGPARQRGDAD